MFRVRQSFEASNMMDEMFISMREFFTPTPEFALASVSESSSRDNEIPMSEQSLRRRRRRRRARFSSGVSTSAKLF